MTRSRVLVALGGLAISAFFLWLAIRDADAAEVKAALEDARIEFVLLAVVVLVSATSSRRCAGRRIANTPRPGLRRFYEMVICGLACNNVLPVRIGELLRAGWLSRDAPMPGGRALGTVALDRVCDVVTLACSSSSASRRCRRLTWLKRIVIGALLAVVRSRGRAGLRALVHAQPGTRPSRRGVAPADRPRHDRHARGAHRPSPRSRLAGAERRRPGRSARSRCSSWDVRSGIDLAPLDAVFVASALALGVAIPSSPGYVGTYQWLGVASLGLLDVPVNEALAFSILMQASWFVPTTLVGGAIIGWRALKMR